MIHDKFPDKKLILSEACIEYCKFAADDFMKNAQKYAHDMIGNMNHGMNGFYDWNIVLDEKGGPNHVGNFVTRRFCLTHRKRKCFGEIRPTIYGILHILSNPGLYGSAPAPIRMNWRRQRLSIQTDRSQRCF